MDYWLDPSEPPISTQYVDRTSSNSALCLCSFNIIHKETMFAVDVFLHKGDDFDRSQLKRRIQETIATDPEQRAYFASPEDIVLAKLAWYRMGGGVSDRQWMDVINVLRVQGERLDGSYLSSWASRLDVADLFNRALEEAGGS